MTVVPSEEPDCVCALEIHNEYVDAALQMRPEDVTALIRMLRQYAGNEADY